MSASKTSNSFLRSEKSLVTFAVIFVEYFLGYLDKGEVITSSKNAYYKTACNRIKIKKPRQVVHKEFFSQHSNTSSFVCRCDWKFTCYLVRQTLCSPDLALLVHDLFSLMMNWLVGKNINKYCQFCGIGLIIKDVTRIVQDWYFKY